MNLSQAYLSVLYCEQCTGTSIIVDGRRLATYRDQLS